MRIAYFILIVALLAACASIESTVHVLGTPTWTKTPAPPEAMNQRVEAAAAEYMRHAPVPRLALFDIAFPSSEDEFSRTGGNGVLLLTALSQDKNELPPKRIYVTLSGQEHALQSIYSVANAHAPSPAVMEVFGSNRSDGLYLFPVHLMDDGAVLTLDFAVNRSGFVFGTFSALERERFGYRVEPPMDAPDHESRTAIMKLVAREYPGFISSIP